MAWNFFVRHYGDDAQQRRDPKYRETWNGSRMDGVLYPRAGTLGGCTAHNAMIMVYPHNADWDALADHRRRVLARGADARIFPAARALPPPSASPTDVLARDQPDAPRLGGLAQHRAARCPRPRSRIGRWSRSCATASTKVSTSWGGRWSGRAGCSRASSTPTTGGGEGRRGRSPVHAAHDAPARAHGHARARSRVARRHPDRLRIELNALATRVIFDGRARRRRRVPLGRAALSRRSPGEPRPGAAPRGAGVPRGDPGRRRVQHAAAPDALGDRPARRPSRATASTCASICRASARISRTATRPA